MQYPSLSLLSFSPPPDDVLSSSSHAYQPLFMSSQVASCGGILFGYDTAALNGNHILSCHSLSYLRFTIYLCPIYLRLINDQFSFLVYYQLYCHPNHSFFKMISHIINVTVHASLFLSVSGILIMPDFLNTMGEPPLSRAAWANLESWVSDTIFKTIAIQ